MPTADRRLLYVTATLRAVAVGMSGMLLGLWCAHLGLSTTEAGAVLGAGLFGAGFACLLVTWRGDAFGRKRGLIVLALLSAAGALLFATSRSVLPMGLAAFIGMLNGNGRDRGAALVLEQPALTATTDAAGRTRTFAVYNLLIDIAQAAGTKLAALPSLLPEHDVGWHVSLGTLVALLAVPALLYAWLSPAVEAPAAAARTPLTPAGRRTVVRLSTLFALDSLGGGFLLTSLLAIYFTQHFGISANTVTSLFFAARLMNAVSHLGAAWLAHRIGLVNTMVFTHIPSSLLMLLIPLAPGFGMAATLLLLREGLVEMDVPTRQSYVMAIVAPHERTTVAGITGLVRLAGWAGAAVVAGASMDVLGMGSALVIGAALKITYDLLLWRAFRHVRPPEEVAAT